MRKRGYWIVGLAASALVGAAEAQPVPPSSEPRFPLLDLPAVSPPPGACAPARLVRLVVRNISPGVASAEATAQPRTIWRLGSSFLRSEEQPDPSRNLQALLIVAEPEIWAINLAVRSGQRSVDPGPDLSVRAPVLPRLPGLPPRFQSLEFGCEPAFVTANAPTAQMTVAWGAEKAGVHIFTAGEHSLIMLMLERRKVPLIVTYARAGKPIHSVRYDEYRPDLPDNPDLFMPPKNVLITEAAAQPPPSADQAPR